MASYPIKMLKDEQNIPFVPLTSTECIKDPNGYTLEQRLLTKLGPSNLHGGTNISVRTEGYECYIDLDLPASLNIINNLTTSTSGQGALDAYQGYVLKNLIDNLPTVIDDVTSTSSTNALSAKQGYILNNKFSSYLPLTGGTVNTVTVANSNPLLCIKDTVNTYDVTPTSTVYPALLWTDKNNVGIGRLELIEASDGSRLMSLYALKPGSTSGGSFFKVGWSSSGNKIATLDGALTVYDNLTLTGGITIGSGFGKKYTFTKSVTIADDWTDVGLAYNDLPTGAYIVYMTNIADSGKTWQGGNVYAGLMTWYASGTNSSEGAEITLHTTGHAHNNYVISLRTLSYTGNTTNTRLQIKSSIAFSQSTNISFTFVKII